MGTKKRKEFQGIKVEKPTYLALKKLAQKRGESLTQLISLIFQNYVQK